MTKLEFLEEAVKRWEWLMETGEKERDYPLLEKRLINSSYLCECAKGNETLEIKRIADANTSKRRLKCIKYTYLVKRQDFGIQSLLSHHSQ